MKEEKTSAQTTQQEQDVKLPADITSETIEEVLRSFDGRHNFKPQKPPYVSLAGLVISIIGWLLLFFLPKRETENFTELMTQIYVVGAISIIAFILGLLGRKRAPGISFFVYLIGGALFVFVLVAFIVLQSLN